MMTEQVDYHADSIGRKMLTDNGLWPKEADAVIAAVVADESMSCMTDRWTDRADCYPETVVSGAWLHVRAAALNWIDANKPKHFAREMFT